MNILLIDGGQAFSFTGGRLNHTLHQTARETLSALGHAIKETVIEAGYDKEAEVRAWARASWWQATGATATSLRKATAPAAYCTAKNT